ncbi:glycosyltransferase family 61 protein, partial [bacterium]|nr:glycosyltransferase family 61 protein [bacterium]
MSYKMYTPDSFTKWFERQIKKQKIAHNLPVDELPNGVIVVDPKTFGFGAFDARGRFVKSSRQVRKNNGQFVPKLPKNMPYRDIDVIYFGNVYPQFGHFLLEHMNRAWGTLRDEYKGAKVVLINNKRHDKIPGYMYDLLTILGVARRDIIILDETTRFRRVIIPHQGFNLPIMSSDEFASAFQHMRERVKGGGSAEKIYMSRDKLGERRTYGERAVQKIFEKNGFKIIYPETMSIADQIAAVKNCRVLAGCAGTALHLALFMPRGGTVIQLSRNTMKDGPAPTQYLIDRVLDHDSIFIAASIEEMVTGHGGFAPQ